MSARLYKCDSSAHLSETLSSLVAAQRFFVVIDQRVAQLHGKAIEPLLALPNCLASYQFEATEKNKSLASVASICDKLLALNMTRQDYVIAIGGGTTSDVTAFCAAIAKRGMRLIIVPTTLLAMVDAAIGAKNGVNSAYGKNSLGCFYKAQAIVYNDSFLNSLTAREWQNGRGECIKYCFLDQSFNLADALAPLEQFKLYASKNIMNFAAYKQAVVAADLYDNDKRKMLNFGHTFGHALESANQNTQLAHGKAVMLGIAITLLLSKIQFGLAPQLIDDYCDWLFEQQWYQPNYWQPFDKLEYFIKRDKKNSAQNITMVLLNDIAKPELVDLEIDQLREVYRGFRNAIVD